MPAGITDGRCLLSQVWSRMIHVSEQEPLCRPYRNLSFHPSKSEDASQGLTLQILIWKKLS